MSENENEVDQWIYWRSSKSSGLDGEEKSGKRERDRRLREEVKQSVDSEYLSIVMAGYGLGLDEMLCHDLSNFVARESKEVYNV